jgi:cell wall synthesis protein KRE9/KNH1
VSSEYYECLSVLTQPLTSFIRIVSILRSGGTVVNYSSRFTLAGMTGTFNAAVLSGVKAVGANTNGPPTEIVPGSGLYNQHPFDPWNIPLGLQTGPTVYAPMQTYPGTKITMSVPTPRYPTSPYSIATTMLTPNPSISVTLTQAVTWRFSQSINSVCIMFL